MNSFKTTIKDQFGNASEFELAVDERKHTGKLSWPLGTHDLVNVRKVEKQNAIHCWIKFNHFNVRCVIWVHSADGIGVLEIRAPRKNLYHLAESDYSDFLSFIDALEIPVDTDAGSSPDQPPGSSQVDFDVELKEKHISLFAAHRAGHELEMRFTRIAINGISYQPYPELRIPGDQGIFIPVRGFERGSQLEIEWELETGLIGGWTRQVMLGVFRNWNLRDNTKLMNLTVDSMERYSGTGILEV